MALARNKFIRQRNAVTKIASYYKMYKAKCELKKRKWASNKIREFIKGFITRKQTQNEFNEKVKLNIILLFFCVDHFFINLV